MFSDSSIQFRRAAGKGTQVYILGLKVPNILPLRLFGSIHLASFLRCAGYLKTRNSAFKIT
jgi:hypothetical protein